ncbi:adenylyl-sulfate kinase [Achromobacter sp. AONIH1]|uniref:adenylyl-sulfate kinase n=1 Tax=unclassified Achromobacter TaxID=2626865 RepID=UPI000CD034BF|nr:adenylyl-sulfate kinase [Achromobacter sp. AONIH1]AUT45172.1 adenylyl-sulfate kinase [Achromobacter sp. AONIH1]
MVIWLIGLSGSGKTTLGKEIARLWRGLAANTVLLDGDELRRVFAHDQTDAAYSVEGRRANAERMTALCEMLDRQGINVVCCILSLFPDMRTQNRERFSRYFEVFMDASMEALLRRDTKGLYQDALTGARPNVVGVDIPFPRPETADLTISTSGPEPDMTQLARHVLGKAGIA